MKTQKKLRIPYYAVIVGCCFLMIFTALGFGSSPRKLFMVAVPKALGLEYGPYSINDSFRYITTSVISLFFGALISRFGPRKLIAGGFAALTAAMLTYSFANGLPGVYLGGILLGAGFAMTGTTMASYVINLWCKERKGTMMGLVLCANGLGGAASMQILSPIINESLYSYRGAYRLAAAVMAVVGVLVVLLFRNSPDKSAIGVIPGAEKKKPKGTNWEGITLKQALHKPYFYAAAICIFLTGMVLQSLVGADANHMNRAGLAPAFVAAAMSVHSLAVSGSKFLMGVLYDKKGLRRTMLLCDGAAFAAILLLILVSDSASGRAMAAVYAVVSALALPLETVMLPLITAELFGQRSYAQMLGIVSAINTAGYSFGPPITNFIFDAVGSYTPVFTAYLAVIAAITAAFMFALSAAKRDRTASKPA